MTLPSFESGNHTKDNRAWLLLFGLDNLVWLSFFIYDTENVMKKPQTKLGQQLSKILNRQGNGFSLVSSGNEYDTFQLEISDNQIMNLICHDYPELAYGILIDTKSIYHLSSKVAPVELVKAINRANLKSTSVITAAELQDKAFMLHFKTFVHLTKRMSFARLLDEAVELHLQEIDEVVSPHFKNIDKEEK